jgi:hypothetical protein
LILSERVLSISVLSKRVLIEKGFHVRHVPNVLEGEGLELDGLEHKRFERKGLEREGLELVDLE